VKQAAVKAMRAGRRPTFFALSGWSYHQRLVASSISLPGPRSQDPVGDFVASLFMETV
jgi:hypothetical protein